METTGGSGVGNCNHYCEYGHAYHDLDYGVAGLAESAFFRKVKAPHNGQLVPLISNLVVMPAAVPPRLSLALRAPSLKHKSRLILLT